MTKISLYGMEFYAHHGYYDEEQVKGNKFVVDISLEADLTKASSSDKLSDTLNYEEVYRVVKHQMDLRSRLLEHAARRIAEALRAAFPQILALELTLTKNQPSLGGIVDRVSVTIDA